jgi:maltoporin
MKNTMYVAKLAAAVALATVTMNASAVEWNGYARSGIGISDDGDQQCTSVQEVGRLANECGTYAELGLTQEVFNRDGKIFKVETMLAYTTNQDNDWEPLDGSDGTIALRQMNIQAKGVLGFAPEATLWAGKRFYQRHDIHHLDFFYWDVSGPGAGVEGVNAGAGKLSLAWMRSDRAGDGNEFAIGGEPDANGNIIDVRYSGIALGSSSLELGLDYYMPNLTDAQDEAATAAGRADDGGLLATAELSTPLMGGVNKVVLQYGTEGYAHALRYFGGGNWYSLENAGKGGETYRIIDWGVIKAGSSVELGYAAYFASYDRDDFGSAHQIMHASVRPMFKWTDYTRTILEVGYFDADDDAWGEDDAMKVTLAQAWSAGPGYWARPEIRVFVSHMTDDDARFRGAEDSVVNFGVQAEAWW